VKANGLLSQWRSYGDDVGYAIVFDPKGLEALLQPEADEYEYFIKLYFGDVVYEGDEEGFKREFRDLLEHLDEIIPALYRGGAREVDTNEFAHRFVGSVSRFKSRGFREENEVRMIACPLTQALYNETAARYPDEVKTGKRLKPIKHRVSGSAIIPYIDLFGFKDQPLPITKVIVGPHRNQGYLVDGVQRLVEGLGIDVTRSQIPFMGTKRD
jgi:hypothetical protein